MKLRKIGRREEGARNAGEPAVVTKGLCERLERIIGRAVAEANLHTVAAASFQGTGEPARPERSAAEELGPAGRGGSWLTRDAAGEDLGDDGAALEDNQIVLGRRAQHSVDEADLGCDLGLDSYIQTVVAVAGHGAVVACGQLVALEGLKQVKDDSQRPPVGEEAGGPEVGPIEAGVRSIDRDGNEAQDSGVVSDGQLKPLGRSARAQENHRIDGVAREDGCVLDIELRLRIRGAAALGRRAFERSGREASCSLDAPAPGVARLERAEDGARLRIQSIEEALGREREELAAFVAPGEA